MPNAEAPPADMLATFLATLRARTAGNSPGVPRPPLPGPELHAVTAEEDLVARFTAAAQATGLQVEQSSAAHWPTAVCTLLRQQGARSVLLQPQPETAFTPQAAAALRAAAAAAGLTTTEDRDDDTLFRVDAAVTGVVAAIAETGTLICTSGPGVARGASLIPPLHVALLARPQLLPDLFDYFARLAQAPTQPANVNLISGPSKTADIEGILITGVHGPGTVYAVIVD